MKPLFDPIRFGGEFRKKILALGLSYRNAAPLIGVSSATLNRIANGKPPDVENYLRIVKWLEKQGDSK